MDKARIKKLKKSGWKIGDYANFLNLTTEEKNEVMTHDELIKEAFKKKGVKEEYKRLKPEYDSYKPAPITVIDDDGSTYEDDLRNHKWYRESCKRLRNGKIITGLRYLYSMTQKDLGQRLGVSRNYISEMENGHRKISPDIAKKLSKIFDQDINDFLNFGLKTK